MPKSVTLNIYLRYSFVKYSKKSIISNLQESLNLNIVESDIAALSEDQVRN